MNDDRHYSNVILILKSLIEKKEKEKKDSENRIITGKEET